MDLPLLYCTLPNPYDKSLTLPFLQGLPQKFSPASYFPQFLSGTHMSINNSLGGGVARSLLVPYANVLHQRMLSLN